MRSDFFLNETLSQPGGALDTAVQKKVMRHLFEVDSLVPSTQYSTAVLYVYELFQR